MIRIAIVEDNPDEQNALCAVLEQIRTANGDVYEIRCFPNGFSFVDTFKPDFDLIFLDIAMPGIDGMNTAKQIRAIDPDVVIVFITSLAQYAMQGYEVEAMDYVLKPADPERISRLMKKAKDKIEKRGSNAEIVVKTPSLGFRKILSRDLVYVRSDEHMLIYVLMQETIETWGSLKAISVNLPEHRFYRLGRSHLINLSFVKALQKDVLIMKNGDEIPFPKSGRSKFLKAMDDFLSL